MTGLSLKVGDYVVVNGNSEVWFASREKHGPDGPQLVASEHELWYGTVEQLAPELDDCMIRPRPGLGPEGRELVDFRWLLTMQGYNVRGLTLDH